MPECQRFELIYMFSKFQSLPSYFGGKRKLVKYIFKPIKKTEGVFIDAFLGGGSVSLYAKAKGYKVIANDIAFRSLIIGKAIIANNSVKLESEDLARLFVKTKHDGFIKKNYCPKVFTSKIADFLDNAVAAAREVENETKRYLLLHLLIKFILSCRQFGKFTHTRDTLDLEARKWEWPLRSKSHAPKNLRMIQSPMLTLEKLKDEVNHGIFDNHQDNEIHQKDVFDFLKTVQGDVVYFDPPYPGSSAYEVEYGILDNLLVGKKLDNKPSGFSNNDADDFLERMFEAASEMRGLEWGRLYEEYHKKAYSPAKVSAEVQKLYADPYVKNRRGIFEYILGGSVDTKLLEVRVFDEATKKAVYATQTAKAEKKGVSNCSHCAMGHDANKSKIWSFAEMDADHVSAWSKGGKSDIKNCEMLCKTHNRAKGNR